MTPSAVQRLCLQEEEMDPAQLVRRLCRTLLEHCPTDSGPSPLDVLGSCQLVRATRYEHFGSDCLYSSLLVPVDGGYEIVINAAESPERQRFSRAHEIIHTYFHPLRPFANASIEEEELCDIGAAELTMPTERFRAFLEQAGGMSFTSVKACCEEFGVSFHAAMRRAVEVTREVACELVGAESRPKYGDPKNVGERVLRIQHCNRSESWVDTRDYSQQRVKENSVIYAAFVHQDERRAKTELGLAIPQGVFEVEAKGFSYAKPNDPHHQEVLVLVKLCA